MSNECTCDESPINRCAFCRATPNACADPCPRCQREDIEPGYATCRSCWERAKAAADRPSEARRCECPSPTFMCTACGAKAARSSSEAFDLREAWDRLRTEIATRVPNHLKSTQFYEALNDVEGGVRAAERSTGFTSATEEPSR